MSDQPYHRGEGECPHSDIHWHIHHQAFHDCNLHYLEIKGRCKLCDKPLIFRGAPLGMTPKHPTMSLGGQEIRLPFLAEGEEPKGKIIGFVGHEVTPGEVT